MDLSKAPTETTEPAPPVEESPDVDETVSEKLFDAVLGENQTGGKDEVPDMRADSSVAEVPEPRSELFGDVSRVPVSATPAETEGGKLLRISGRMFDLVTFGSGAALVATFFGFRMYQSLFDAGNPLPAVVFAAIASAGMVAALILFHLSNSEGAKGERRVKQGRHQEALVRYERAIRMVRRPSYA